MNARERVSAVLNREKTDRVPVDIWLVPERADPRTSFLLADVMDEDERTTGLRMSEIQKEIRAR